ncbi:hypothetical protein HAX54_006611, partial [Datura stramonium]|nr:hypothetical protein [Datura stramonium]
EGTGHAPLDQGVGMKPGAIIHTVGTSWGARMRNPEGIQQLRHHVPHNKKAVRGDLVP